MIWKGKRQKINLTSYCSGSSGMGMEYPSTNFYCSNYSVTTEWDKTITSKNTVDLAHRVYIFHKAFGLNFFDRTIGYVFVRNEVRANLLWTKMILPKLVKLHGDYQNMVIFASVIYLVPKNELNSTFQCRYAQLNKIQLNTIVLLYGHPILE